MTPAEFPDLIRLAQDWLDSPAPLRAEYDATRIGALLLRQLLPTRTAPGGHSALRGSNVGTCRRALAYRVAGTPETGKAPDAHSRLVWAVGDVTEALLTIAIEESLPEGWSIRHTRDDQHHGAWDLGGVRVPVHADGLGRMPDGTGFTLEVKSAPGYRLDEWRREGWTRATSYRWQVHAAQAAYRVRWTYVAALDKGTGGLWGTWLEWDDEIDALARAHLLDAARGAPDDTARVLPDGTELCPTPPSARSRDKDRRPRLPWQCRYCAFHPTCWPEAEPGWDGAKPVLRIAASPSAQCVSVGAAGGDVSEAP